MHRGYIKLYRAIADNKMWDNKPFEPVRAWIDMLLLANHKEGQIRPRGIPVDVKRGQLGWSIKGLASRWGWSEGKVSRFFSELQNEAQIEIHKNNVTSLITIINYELYQGDTEKTERKTKTRRGADGEQTGTNKNDKNDKNDKNKELPSEALRLADLLAEKILLNKPDYRELQKDKSVATRRRFAEDIDKAIRIDKRSSPELEEIIVWCQDDDFWKGNIYSGKKLREQFDKLVMSKQRSNTGQTELKYTPRDRRA